MTSLFEEELWNVIYLLLYKLWFKLHNECVRHVTVTATAPQCARVYPTIFVVINGELTICGREVLSTNSPTKSYPPRGCCTFTSVSNILYLLTIECHYRLKNDLAEVFAEAIHKEMEVSRVSQYSQHREEVKVC